MSNTRLAIWNSLFSLLTLTCRLVGNTVIFIIIARIPSIATNDFGQINYAIALASIFVMFSQFGLIPYFVREVAADPSLLRNYARSVIALRITLSMIGLGGMFIFVHTNDLSNQGRIVCYIMATALYIGSFSVDFQALFQSCEQMRLELFGTVTENTLLLLLAGLCYWMHPTIIQVACIFLITKSLALLVNYLICGRHILWIYPKINIGLWRTMIIEAAPFAMTGVVAVGIVQIDTILIRQLCIHEPERSIGIFQAAARLFLIPMLLPDIVLKVFLPQFSRMHGRMGAGLCKDLGRVNNILLTFGLLIGITTVIRGSDMIELAYGGKYADAGPLLQIFGFTIMMRFGAAYNLYFTIRNRVWFRVLSATLALVAAVSFNYILIPQYGPLGAVYASVIAHFVYWIPYLSAMLLAENTVVLGWKLSRASFAGVALSLLLYATSEIEIVYMLPAYAITILLGVACTVSARDLRKILKPISNKWLSGGRLSETAK